MPVRTGGFEVVLEGLAEHDLVVAASEGIIKKSDWVEKDIRVGPLGLTSGRPVKVPYRHVYSSQCRPMQCISCRGADIHVGYLPVWYMA